MRPFNLLMKTFRNARPIHDVYPDRKLAFGKGFLEIIQCADFLLWVLRVAQYEVEIAGCVAVAIDTAAICPDFCMWDVRAQQSFDLFQIFFRQVERDGARFVSYHFTDKPELTGQFHEATAAIKFLTEI